MNIAWVTLTVSERTAKQLILFENKFMLSFTFGAFPTAISVNSIHVFFWFFIRFHDPGTTRFPQVQRFSVVAISAASLLSTQTEGGT